MAKGRKRKAQVLHLIQGTKANYKKTIEPKFSCAVVPPPSLDASALKEWERLAPEMERNGLLTSGDVAGFAAYCQSYSRWVKAETKLAEMMDKSEDTLFGGMIFKTNKNNLSQNPLIRIADRAMENMVRICAEFGMTPSSRSRAGRGSSDGSGNDPSAGNW